MQISFNVLMQYFLPQHLLSRFAGWLGNCKCKRFKNFFIKYFIKKYKVDLEEAVISNPEEYSDFNSFFTRYLKPELRPITQEKNTIASPVDGYISQIGKIENNLLLQAKGVFFNLETLLGNQAALAAKFAGGNFVTLYLSPKDYHRIHMPVSGVLKQTIFIPGKLFSVNQQSSKSVPQLFARNERLVCYFETENGPMAVILVGAMLVGSINAAWEQKPAKANKITIKDYDEPRIMVRGEEVGFFQMGSTVIVLFAKNRIDWLVELQENSRIKMGEVIGVKLKVPIQNSSCKIN